MFYFLDAPATLMLLIVIVMVSGYALFSHPGIINALAFRPGRLRDHREYYRLGSAWLVHGGVAHLAFNLFTLYSFGRGLEAVLGTSLFLVVFFVSELAANGLTYVLKKDSPGYGSVGASGAISGVLFAYCLFRPMDMIYLFAAIPIPAWLFAILFVVVSIVAMKRQDGGWGIAHEAHLGGAIGGVVTTLALRPEAWGIFLGRLGF